MHTYKLHYFPLRARAEAIRLMFLYKGVKFEDEIVFWNEWKDKKPTFPINTLPVLEIDGKHQISQSWAILRYVAKKLGLAGKDDMEAAQLDQVLELWRDWDNAATPWMSVLAGFSQENPNEFLNEKVIPALEKYGPQFEHLLRESGSGFFGRSGISYVDFYIADQVYTLHKYRPEAMEAYFPYLVEHMKRVHALPGLQAHFTYYKYTGPKA
ncbi:Protein CBR-GST-6.1 [Aphelenchoides bicaudatus]|nr:Protein CBR-GST-6.1 [Aphelenchoides bicaudatus]